MPQKKYNKLTHAAIMKRKKPGRMGDGPGGYGLTVLLRPKADGSLSRRVYQNIKIQGAPRTLPLGEFDKGISLDEARDIVRANWRIAKDGGDPRQRKEGPVEPEQPDPVDREIRTCGDAMGEYIELAAAGWVDSDKTQARVRQIRRHVLTPIENELVDEVTRHTLRDVFAPIWTSIPSSSRELLGFTKGFFDWCIAKTYRDDNPADAALLKLLPRVTHRPVPFASVPHREISDAVAKIPSYPARDDAGKVLLELIVHTGVRSQEGRLATTNEFDLDNMLWHIPAEHTKRRRPFTVPLSTASARIAMRAMSQFEGRHPNLVFPTKRGKTLKAAILPKILKRLKLSATAHGFRATFRTWCAARGVQREIAELALNHQLTPLEQSYIRGDLVEVRRPLMEAWSAYIEGTLPDDWMCGTHTVQESFREEIVAWQRRAEEAERRLDAVLAELAKHRNQNTQIFAELAKFRSAT